MSSKSFWTSFATKWNTRENNKENEAIVKQVTESVKEKLVRMQKLDTKKQIPSIEESIFGDMEDGL